MSEFWVGRANNLARMAMEPQSDQKSWLSRLIRNPIAIVGAIGSILVVLANAEPAVNSATTLWQRWTVAPAGLDTTWQGSWKSREGFTYDFAMQLNVAETGDADGQISWKLIATPKGSPLEPRVGDTGFEYVRGHYDRARSLAVLDGYEVSDPTLLGTDTYKFQIKSDKLSFVGMTKSHGEWTAEANGTVIVTEK